MNTLLALHIIAFVCWFAGLFYLPRLYVYHTQQTQPAAYLCFCTMERKLYRFIMHPAAVVTLLSGLTLFYLNATVYTQAIWFHLKMACVAGLFIYHIALGRLLRVFHEQRNRRTERFYRWINEIPTVLLIAIVLLAKLQPL